MTESSAQSTPSSVTVLGLNSSEILSPNSSLYMASFEHSPSLPPYPTSMTNLGALGQPNHPVEKVGNLESDTSMQAASSPIQEHEE